MGSVITLETVQPQRLIAVPACSFITIVEDMRCYCEINLCSWCYFSVICSVLVGGRVCW